MENKCERCISAIQAIADAYSTATPAYQEQVVQSEAVDLQETQPCPPGAVCGMLRWVIERFE